MGTRGSFR